MGRLEYLSSPASVSMADEWFEFATPDHFWMQWRHRVLLQALDSTGPPPIRNALEIGCGHGVVRQMVERDLGIAVDGCDLNERALDMATKGKGRLLVYNIFDRNSALLTKYDLVMLMDVIEHLDDDLAFLQASLEHLKPGGLVAINVPAHMALFGKYDEVAGHKRRYDVNAINSLFRRAKVTPLRTAYWGFSLLPLLVMRKIVLRFVSPSRTIRIGFAQQNPITKAMFHLMQRVETSIPFSMPAGSSLFALGRINE